MDLTGPWMDDAAADNLYKYNGKEQNTDFGLHWSDYGAVPGNVYSNFTALS